MADDKRIRELQTDTALPLNWRLPFDFTGLPAAQYRTLQQVVDVMNANRDLQMVLSGSTNPDDALGNDGDTYYKFVEGGEFSVWFKQTGSWGLLFTIDLSNPDDRLFSVTLNGSGEYDFTPDSIRAFASVTIYNSAGDVVPYTYNNTTKKVTGGIPAETINVRFI